ncbi:GHKL domain-containing protein [Colidextribacter sp. OB.20]|nr:GHKL domain-containing protein [Colidextribacter sp. OB.20]
MLLSPHCICRHLEAAVPVRENGQLKTTKAGGGLHGWGLKSAQTAAEKYDGMVQAGVSGEVFRAVATLSYQGVEDFLSPAE